jgi:hypothetical protein
MKRAASLAAALALLAPTSVAAEDLDKSDNVELLYGFEYEGVNDYFSAGTDLAFDGDFIYAPQHGPNGKIHIFERNDEPEEDEDIYELRGTFPCAGTQNDVAVVESGILAVAYHSSRCGLRDDGSLASPGAGVSLHDVSDPANPRLLGAAHGLPGGTHTLTVHPTEPVIYASPGGLANGQGIQQIIDVSDPTNPTVGGTFFQNPAGCHDFTFLFETGRELGVCVGLTESTIWDVSDPFEPQVISRIVNPLIFFHHSAAVTSDGQYLVLGDEAFGAHECEGGPSGAMFLYDISVPEAPVLLSYFAVDRNDGGPLSTGRETWCTAHLFNFIPGTHILVSSWYTGGMNVIDWSDPLQPQEIAHYQVAAGSRTESTNYWSAYWHEGRIYANDRGRGVVEAFEVEGLEEGESAEDLATTTRGGWVGGPIDEAPAWMQSRALQPALLTTDAAYSCSLRG